MSQPNFRNMSPSEFQAFCPQNQDEAEAHEAESEFREWCVENEQDPQDDGARDNYKEQQAETGDAFWNGLDENDRAGWEDNMNKD